MLTEDADMPQTHEVERLTYEPIPTPDLNKVSISAPFKWLKQGAADYFATPVMSITYGLIFALIGAGISIASINQPQFALTFWTGFLLVGPFLAIGLYRAAQMRENGEKVSLVKCLSTLGQHKVAVSVFTLMMLLIMVAWIRFSTLAVALYFGQLSPGLEAFSSALTSTEGLSFLTVLFASGGVFAFIVYAASVLTLPIIIDKKAEMIPALITSFKAVFEQPAVMLTWAAMVAGLTFIGMATFFVGLVFIFPLLGYATWHCYRDLVK
jgi:uncharacterized membrane protein